MLLSLFTIFNILRIAMGRKQNWHAIFLWRANRLSGIDTVLITRRLGVQTDRCRGGGRLRSTLCGDVP